MDSSSICTSESIHSLAQSEKLDDKNQTLPLTSSNLEILQMTNQIHAKHQYIASYVKNQITILALEAKLEHQRRNEMQTLVPLETAPFEKETIICCTDRKYDDDARNKKRHLSKTPKRHQQRYNQEKLDLIKQGLCGSSSSFFTSPYSSSFTDDQPNPLASLLFSSIVSSCSSSHSSSFSFFNAIKESKNESHSSLWKRLGHKKKKPLDDDLPDFLAFRYPKMISFHKLRDTALQLLLSTDPTQESKCA